MTLDQPTLAHIAEKAGLLVDPTRSPPQSEEIASSRRRSPSRLRRARSAPTRAPSRSAASSTAPSRNRRPTGRASAVLAPNKAVEDAASSIRGRIFALGLLVLAAVMLIAYILAPSLARTRVAQQQRAIAERVLEHVADGVLLLDPHGVVRFWNHAAEVMTGIPAREGDAENAPKRRFPGWRAAVQRIPVGDAHGGNGGVSRPPCRSTSGRKSSGSTRRASRSPTERLHVPRHHRGRTPRPGEDGLRRDRLARAAHSPRLRVRRRRHVAGAVQRARPGTARATPRPARRAGEPALDDHRRASARQQARRTHRLGPAAGRARELRRRRARAPVVQAAQLRAPLGHRDRALDAAWLPTRPATATRSRRCSRTSSRTPSSTRPAAGESRS